MRIYFRTLQRFASRGLTLQKALLATATVHNLEPDQIAKLARRAGL